VIRVCALDCKFIVTAGGEKTFHYIFLELLVTLAVCWGDRVSACSGSGVGGWGWGFWMGIQKDVKEPVRKYGLVVIYIN